jgi:putative protease
MSKNKKPELVAPAGSLEKLKYAIEYGADAVYCGVPDFSLRVRINSFNKEQILEGIEYARARGKKIYITTNIFAHNKNIKELENFLGWIKKQNILPDAFIASDPGVIKTIKKILPGINIHLSTQANCTNWQAAKFWYELGIKRVVLGREVTLKEIKEIKKKVPKLELEIFVHGAMCMAYSGRCFLSAWMTRRSANLGDCAQSCRWNYHLTEQMRPGEYIPVEMDTHGTYLLNSKDLCLIEHLKELKDAGIDAFKIEGRAKSIHYLATTIKAYRNVIDSTYKKDVIKKSKKELAKNVSREYTTGFLFDDNKERCSSVAEAMKDKQNFENRSAGSDWEFVGEVLCSNTASKNAEKHCFERIPPFLRSKKPVSRKTVFSEFLRSNTKGILIKPHNSFSVGNTLEILQPPQLRSRQASGENIKIKVKKIINAKNGQEVPKSSGGNNNLYFIPTTKQVLPMSILRKRK